MAMAVQKLFPDAKVTIGPWIENGFYYDFDMEPLTDKDLKRIKKEMVSTICSQVLLLSYLIVWGGHELGKVFISHCFQVPEFICYIICRIASFVKIYNWLEKKFPEMKLGEE